MTEEYYDLKSPRAYTGARNFKKSKLKWLKGQYAYTLHKPVVRKYRKNKFYSKGINDFWQADLADLSSLAKWNGGVRYLLFVIDVFSKFLHIFPLKRKRPEDVLEAFKKLSTMPNLLMTDKGTEFQNEKARKYFEKIKYYSSNNPDTKASVAERAIRTIKSRLYRYMTHKGTKKYTDILQDVVNGYNNSKHRSIGMAPAEVNDRNENIVRNRLYKPPKALKKHKYYKGDTVRIAKERGPFHKGYLPQWSEEIFTVTSALPRDPPAYKLTDYYREPISGVFYEPDLQKVDPVYRIERIVKRQGSKALVKWMGYTEKTWEPLANVL